MDAVSHAAKSILPPISAPKWPGYCFRSCSWPSIPVRKKSQQRLFTWNEDVPIFAAKLSTTRTQGYRPQRAQRCCLSRGLLAHRRAAERSEEARHAVIAPPF